MKPRCNYCKHKKWMQPHYFCKLTKEMDEVGSISYMMGERKNKDFKCADFIPSFFHRRKYK